MGFAAENLEKLRGELAADPTEIIPLSAGTGDLGIFKERLREAVEQARHRYY